MIIKLYANDTYHLFEDMKASHAINFAEILKHCDGKYNKQYKLYRKFDKKWEQVGTIRVRDLLLMQQKYNPIFQSLKKLRNGYTWGAFCKSLKEKLGDKK